MACIEELQNIATPGSCRMFTGIKALLTLITFSTLLCFGVDAQVPDQRLRTALSERAAFAADEFSLLEQGEAIVKLLPANDRREVAVCGVIKLPTTPELSLAAFQQSLNQVNRKSILQTGRFSRPPKLADLELLTLSNRDIADLKQCVAGHCKLKLSAAMIERFRREINWNALDHPAQANQLLRQMIAEYVQQYLERGDSALIEYGDEARPARLAQDQQSLLTELLYINEAAPEFSDYLKNFPSGSLPHVENTLSWAKIKFGLKPVVIIMHVATYASHSGAVNRILVVSKQIYANHYFDASLSLTAVIGIATAAGVQSYLLYVNHSRAAGLAGAFSKFKHKLVESEALDNLEDLLQQTRANIEASPVERPVSVHRPTSERLLAWLGGLPQVVRWFVVVVMLCALLYFVVPRMVQHARLPKKNSAL